MEAYNANRIRLNPGDFYFGHAGDQVQTLLGSCIAISLWHPHRKIGGLCHFALPEKPQHSDPTLNGRYGSDCIRLFQQNARLHNSQLNDYQAKVFGGGNIRAGSSAGICNNTITLNDSIGQRNSAAALHYLTREGVSILVVHVGEFGYRDIIFDITTGCVWVKFTPMHNQMKVNNLSGKI